jgi:outer membrane protein assembly factor BamB
VLLGTGYGLGTRSLKITKQGDEWIATEEWTTKDMKPYFNDFVLHEGHLYGFDHDIFCCIDAGTGKRKWKQGRYGCGQVLLVADSGHLLIVREKDGAIVLAEAKPDKHRELAVFKALNNKTWNHPVLVGNRLYVRNDEEAVCLELALGTWNSTASEPAAATE